MSWVEGLESWVFGLKIGLVGGFLERSWIVEVQVWASCWVLVERIRFYGGEGF